MIIGGGIIMNTETKTLDPFWKSAEELILNYICFKSIDLENQIQSFDKKTLSSVIISLQANETISTNQANELRKTFLSFA